MKFGDNPLNEMNGKGKDKQDKKWWSKRKVKIQIKGNNNGNGKKKNKVILLIKWLFIDHRMNEGEKNFSLSYHELYHFHCFQLIHLNLPIIFCFYLSLNLQSFTVNQFNNICKEKESTCFTSFTLQNVILIVCHENDKL